jgi:hypothetical protein
MEGGGPSQPRSVVFYLHVTLVSFSGFPSLCARITLCAPAPCALRCPTRSPTHLRVSLHLAVSAHQSPVAKICSFPSVLVQACHATYVMNTFRRRTHSARHFSHSPWICFRSSGEIRGAPVRRGPRRLNVSSILAKA